MTHDMLLLWASSTLTTFSILAIGAAVWTLARRPSPEIIPCAGPITRLSFECSLDPVLFAQAAEEDSLEQVETYLGKNIGDVSNITIQSLKIWLSRSELVVGASPEVT